MELDISVRAKEKNLKAHQVVRERTYDLQFLKKSLKNGNRISLENCYENVTIDYRNHITMNEIFYIL